MVESHRSIFEGERERENEERRGKLRGSKEIIEICLREEEGERERGRLSDNERSWRRHSGWKMNNVDERFNPFRSAGFSFHRASRA